MGASSGSGGSGGSGAGANPGLSFEAIDLDGDPTFVTHFEFLPGSMEFIATTRGGSVLHYRLNDDETVLLGQFELPGVHVEQDCGIISATFDPDFEENGAFYLGYCASLSEAVVSRYVLDTEDYAAIPESGVEIFRAGDVEARQAIHSVGKMGFDDQQNLWVLFGEKGESHHAQNPTTPLGSVLRMRPLAEGGYEAPNPPNPSFPNSPEIPIVYAYGLRSPWTGFLDSLGRYWVGDVGASGDDSVEEINLVSEPGLNFGWRRSQGPCTEDCDGLTDPVRSWPRRPTSAFELEDPDVTPANARVAWAGLEYTAQDRDQYQGHLQSTVLYGDMCLGFVRGIQVDSTGDVLSDRHLGHLAGASAWQVGSDGFIYAVTYTRCTHSTGADLNPGKLMRARLAQ